MQTPQHPGRLIKDLMGINLYGIANQLKVHPVTAGNLIRGKIKISEGMAGKIAYMMKMYSVKPKVYQIKNYWLKMNDQYYDYMREIKNKEKSQC